MMHTRPAVLKTMFRFFIFGFALYSNSATAQTVPSLPENQLVLPAKAYTVPLVWLGDSIDSKWEPHTALLIPVKLPNCPRQFFMQFDLGHPYSVFYRNKLLAIQSQYPRAVQLNASTDKLKSFTFKVGKIPVTAREIPVQQFDSSAIDWGNNNIEIIGTIGTDFIDNKTAVINYPKMQLTVAPAVPGKLQQRISFTDFIYARRSIMLPAIIQGRQTLLFFDTGSSMYQLLTDKKTAQSLAVPGIELLQRRVKSWDKQLTANSLATHDSMAIAGTPIPIRYATYMEGYSSSQLERMMQLGIGGMTGNKIFLDHILVLDIRNKKFGLLRSR